jgi:hypothetical protein
MAPFITSTKQLETLVQTFNTLVKNPETELGANIRGTTLSQSSGEKQTQESATKIQGPAKNLPDVKKEPTDEGVQGPAKAPPGVKKELTDEEVRKLRKVMDESPNPEFRKRAEQMLREHNFQQY